MRILLTGSNGNIAKMIKKNLESVFDIICITRNEVDLLDYKSIFNYLKDKEFDILIHAAISGGRRTKEEKGEIVYQNLLMFENLIQFAYKFKFIINFDSGAIYDRSSDIYCRKEEELFLVPTDYYGFSKYMIYKSSLHYKNVVNFRIFSIFHVNEELDRFIKSCFLAKHNGTNITIFNDKYFDFMYEDDFIKVLKYYIEQISSDNISFPRTLNLSYTKKYKLSEIANIILDNKKNQIIIIDDSCLNNYCGDSSELNKLGIELDGLEISIKKYEVTLFN